MTSQLTDVVEAVKFYVAKGYDREYRVKGDNLLDIELGSTLDPCTFRVDAALRLESGDDAEDASHIYAITDTETGHKGLLMDVFDVFDDICHHDLSDPLVVHREIAAAGDQDADTKHGLRKVFKSDFERDSERYVLREGFPDFPPCPFGGAFSELGFDTADQSYVWLVTSILKDSRLIRAPYQGEDVISNE